MNALNQRLIIFRTKQEEARTYRKNHNIKTNSSDVDSTPSYDYPSFTVSTEVCIYIQGFLVAALFVFGILR